MLKGCSFWSECFTCPFDDCLLDDNLNQLSVDVIRSEAAFIDSLLRPKSGSIYSSRKVSCNAYYLANRERCIARAKAYYYEHREECIARSKARYYANRDELKARALARYYRLKSQNF